MAMVGKIFLNLGLFGVIVLTIFCHGAELNSNEDEARIFLNQTSDKLFNLHEGTANHAFKDLNYTYDQYEANRNYAIFLNKMFEDSRKFDFKNFKDKELTYAFEMLAREANMHVIGEKPYLELWDSLNQLDYLENEDFIDDLHDSSTELSYSPDIEEIIEKSKDPTELQYYWSGWRNFTGKWTMDNLDITLKAIKQAAKLNEKSPFEFWMRGFDISDMEKLMTEIQPLYMELHAFVRNLLRKKYGESITAPDGLIPDHLFRQINDQLHTKQSLIEDLYPYESLPRPNMDKFTSTELYKIIDQLFENLGFEKYPASIWGDNIRLANNESGDDDKDNNAHEDDDDKNDDPDHDDDSEASDDEDDDDDKECAPRVWNYSPTIYIEYCKNMGYWDLLNAYVYMSQIYYAKEMKGLPAYFFSYPNNLEDGVGKAVVLSASTHHNLKAIGLISEYNTKPEVEMNRLLRRAIRHLMTLYVPMDFVHMKVMAGLVSGNITKAELNKHYWQLMEKYAGVGPPKGHSTDTYDLPLQFYKDMINNHMSSDFTMEVLSYQIYKKLCELSGHYPKEPLHLCDINGSKDAGNALKKMMKLGNSKPFSEVLASMFPEDPAVRTEGLLEYYSPMKKLLAEKNKEANVKPGWKSSV